MASKPLRSNVCLWSCSTALAVCWLHNPVFQQTWHIAASLRLLVPNSLQVYRHFIFHSLRIILLRVVDAHASLLLKLLVVSSFTCAVASSTVSSQSFFEFQQKTQLLAL